MCPLPRSRTTAAERSPYRSPIPLSATPKIELCTNCGWYPSVSFSSSIFQLARTSCCSQPQVSSISPVGDRRTRRSNASAAGPRCSSSVGPSTANEPNTNPWISATPRHFGEPELGLAVAPAVAAAERVAEQRPGVGERPAVVRAAERRGVAAGEVADLVGPVGAAVEQEADLALAVAGHDHRLRADRLEHVVVRLGNLAGVPDEHPRPVPDPLQLGRPHRRVGVQRTVHPVVVDERVPTDVVGVIAPPCARSINLTRSAPGGSTPTRASSGTRSTESSPIHPEGMMPSRGPPGVQYGLLRLPKECRMNRNDER